jgi:hypothetical protein|tara:strand:- start:4548 stop:4721 length:174 start_codon:yes stop_codon:yes gene_type:complete
MKRRKFLGNLAVVRGLEGLNPWPKDNVHLYWNGKKAEVIHVANFSFPAQMNENITLK